MPDQAAASDGKGQYRKLDLTDQDGATKAQSSVIDTSKQAEEGKLATPPDSARMLTKMSGMLPNAIIGDNTKMQHYKDLSLQRNIILSMVCQCLLCFIGVFTMHQYYWLIMLALFAGVLISRVVHLGLLHTSFYQANPGWSTALEFIKSYAPTSALTMVLESAMLDDCYYRPKQVKFATFDAVFLNGTASFIRKYDIECNLNWFQEFMLNTITLLVARVVVPWMACRYIYKRAVGVWKLNLREERNQRELTFAILHVIDVSVFSTMAWEVESFVFLKRMKNWQLYYKCVNSVGLVGSVIYALQFSKAECMHSKTKNLIPMMLIDLPFGLMRAYFFFVGLTVNEFCLAKNVIIVVYTAASLCCGDDNCFVKAITYLIKQLPGGGEADAQVQMEDATTFKHQATVAALMKGQEVPDRQKREALVYFDKDANGSLSLDEVHTMLASTHYSNWLIQEAYQKIKDKKDDVDVDDIVHSEILRQASQKSQPLFDFKWPGQRTREHGGRNDERSCGGRLPRGYNCF